MADKSALQIISEELPQFWQGEQAAGARGFIKGLGDLLGISSASEPESVMSRYPSEENALRSMTPLAAATVPLSKAVAPIARFVSRNPLTTGAALTYATEDPTNMLVNPLALAATYAPEAEAVVKPKGGNWLNSVEKALASLKSGRIGPTVAEREADLARIATADPERYRQLVNDVLPIARRNEAWDNWVGGPLTKYVKTYMGTAEDPVRKLAEQGILHVNPDELNISRYGIESHPALMGKSPEAKSWEAASDLVINPLRAQDLSDLTKLSDPWTAKLNPEQTIYGLSDPQNLAGDLGFMHIKDEIRGAMNPNSTLPENLRLKPEDLKQMGMEKAVRHVAAINAWREAQQAEANLAKAMNPATHTVKEYPEGYRMVELAPPKIPMEDEGLGALEEALKYEGDVMGHCVGGYCGDVFEGNSRIFSLRDAKGRPHATIETAPGSVAKAIGDLPMQERYGLEKYVRESEFGGVMPGVRDEDKYWQAIDNEYVKRYGQPLDRIVQIKGKGNKAVPEKYQPMIQDFIKSGNWGEIGDLGNAGLLRGPEGKGFMTREEMLKEYENLPEIIKNTGAVEERIGWLRDRPVSDYSGYDFGGYLDYLRQANPQHFAGGGSVQPAHFDDLTAFLSR